VGNNSSSDRVDARYFETIGTPILRGRGFQEGDTATSQHVAVVNETWVKKFLPDKMDNPIGQHFGKGDESHAGDYEIVGVCKDAIYLDPDHPARPTFFVPLTQTHVYSSAVDRMVESSSMYMGTLVLHTASNPDSFQEQVRRTLASIDPNLAPLGMRSFEEQLKVRTSENTLISRLSAVFGLVALALASIGLYGLTAYQVTRRTSEIGVRMALGAARGSILGLVLRNAFTQVLIGLVIGFPFVWYAGKLISNQLFGVRNFELTVFLVAVVALAGSALLATIMPAIRAASTDPLKALRTE